MFSRTLKFEYIGEMRVDFLVSDPPAKSREQWRGPVARHSVASVQCRLQHVGLINNTSGQLGADFEDQEPLDQHVAGDLVCPRGGLSCNVAGALLVGNGGGKSHGWDGGWGTTRVRARAWLGRQHMSDWGIGDDIEQSTVSRTPLPSKINPSPYNSHIYYYYYYHDYYD